MKLYRVSFVCPAPKSVVVDAETPDEAVERAIDYIDAQDLIVTSDLHLEVIARSE
jgi:hypothetical protein